MALENPFVRFDARLLDPTTAAALDDRPLQATAYVTDRLLVTAASRAEAAAILDDIDATLADTAYARADRRDPFAEVETDDRADPHNRRARLLRAVLEAKAPVTFAVRLASTAPAPAPRVDAWEVLRILHAAGVDRRAAAGGPDGVRFTGIVGLDHLMFAAAFILGNPVHPIANALVGGDGVHPIANSAYTDASYQSVGFGGRGPVAVTLAGPRRSCDDGPHILTLDTGVGEHPWFAPPFEPVVSDLTVTIDGQVDHVGRRADPATDPEGAGSVPDRMTGLLASHAGHGTFLSGLLRQTCPDARLSTLRIMDADGVVPEEELATALMTLAVRQTRPEVPAGEHGRVDRLVLSLGYYAEIEDEAYTAGLENQLLALAEDGLEIFAAAGNDCTERRSYPAAFAVVGGFRTLHRLHSVRALNPDGATVAMFSNDGAWVTDEAVGANVVSTLPTTFQASFQPLVSSVGPNGRTRTSLDPDDFRSGFGVWSGTSFATPVRAGRWSPTAGARPEPDADEATG